MQQVKNIFSFFSNKYIIALTVFIVLMLFIDHNDIFNQFDRRKQLNNLLASKHYYEQQIAETKKNLSDLQNNSAALEKYAREKFLLKRDNEDVFIAVPQNSQKSSDNKQ